MASTTTVYMESLDASTLAHLESKMNATRLKIIANTLNLQHREFQTLLALIEYIKPRVYTIRDLRTGLQTIECGGDKTLVAILDETYMYRVPLFGKDGFFDSMEDIPIGAIRLEIYQKIASRLSAPEKRTLCKALGGEKSENKNLVDLCVEQRPYSSVYTLAKLCSELLRLKQANVVWELQGLCVSAKSCLIDDYANRLELKFAVDRHIQAFKEWDRILNPAQLRYIARTYASKYHPHEIIVSRVLFDILTLTDLISFVDRYSKTLVVHNLLGMLMDCWADDTAYLHNVICVGYSFKGGY
jgi:hypothetical protein